ncbi:MAG TPA: barstar family protein [Pirellulales bacterium]|jgi:ribonuclease inhibitor
MGIDSREHFWQTYVDVVRPDGAEYFGRNLNAFDDALWGGPGWPGDDFTLRILHSEQLAKALGVDFLERVREICDDAGRAKLELL